jgi:hypothetical protein
LGQDGVGNLPLEYRTGQVVGFGRWASLKVIDIHQESTVIMVSISMGWYIELGISS